MISGNTEQDRQHNQIGYQIKLSSLLCLHRSFNQTIVLPHTSRYLMSLPCETLHTWISPATTMHKNLSACADGQIHISFSDILLCCRVKITERSPVQTGSLSNHLSRKSGSATFRWSSVHANSMTALKETFVSAILHLKRRTDIDKKRWLDTWLVMALHDLNHPLYAL